MLVDSGSTSNYISAQCQPGLDLEVQPKRDFERLTLANGSGVHAQGYVRFVLHCGDYDCKILTRVFSNLQEELILGIPWLIKANPTIDWTIRQVKVDRNGMVHTLPCYRRCQNNSSGAERESESEREINFISANTFKKILQRNSRGE